eukprot:scaffold590_cov100-Skeletonema_dohrnii-CCMP3373.AAC.9
MPSKAIYKSKHAFNGSPTQSQLSFPAGATIVAEVGQSGAWWWGRCNGVSTIEGAELRLRGLD